jgi:hypothetical protein
MDATAELFDPVAGKFSPTGSMTFVRSSAQAMLLQDGRVLVVGGYNDSGDLASAELFWP